jgi:hypothetical protein
MTERKSKLHRISRDELQKRVDNQASGVLEALGECQAIEDANCKWEIWYSTVNDCQPHERVHAETVDLASVQIRHARFMRISNSAAFSGGKDRKRHHALPALRDGDHVDCWQPFWPFIPSPCNRLDSLFRQFQLRTTRLLRFFLEAVQYVHPLGRVAR